MEKAKKHAKMFGNGGEIPGNIKYFFSGFHRYFIKN